MTAVDETRAGQRAMRRAVELAARGAGTVLPNPVVGCVITAGDGTVVGEGWHERAGGPHAEVNALAQAGDRARGATAYVTLEPCNHTGRTGPCTEALIEAGVGRVVAAVRDPWAPAAGGLERLAAAGVVTEAGLLAAEAEGVNEVWLTATRLRRPFVTWKFAATLDGRSAAADGTSRWITGEAARRDVHRLRAQVDTMLVGVGTVLADDPALTARDDAGGLLERQPLRVVADTHGRTPPLARVRDGQAPHWVATAAELGRDDAGHLDLAALLGALYERDRRHVMLEGGPTLAGAMIAQGLVDRVVAYLAPALLGDGPNALAGAGVTTIGEAVRLRPREVVQLGDDVRVTAVPEARRPASGPASRP
ncbi:bifunctional diaminohydroxyphosphoribosylaminopyrimidine deaminase/5-amino-6-(5-phosphoribosylamino)uracil reductase RibD [Spongisporangium articulatum]|uniref:Riboflavin biosynthesis protein RibD n=1 Tax=Spongisporangium articulatum TaxID=3362603 RepID=A0ABW8AQY4_9ACTN